MRPSDRAFGQRTLFPSHDTGVHSERNSSDTIPIGLFRVVEPRKGSSKTSRSKPNLPTQWFLEPTPALVGPRSMHLEGLRDAIMAQFPCIDNKSDAEIDELANGFLARGLWCKLFDLTETHACNVTSAVDRCKDEENYSALPFKLTLTCAEIIGFRNRGASVHVLADIKFNDDCQTPTWVLLAPRPEDFNHASVAAALAAVADERKQSPIASLCYPSGVNTPVTHWKTKYVDRMPDLTDAQRNVLLRACTQPLTVLWGPPGTGKTSTLARLFLMALKLEKAVMVTTVTHPAKKELLEKLTALLDKEKTKYKMFEWIDDKATKCWSRVSQVPERSVTQVTLSEGEGIS